ncbi:hypothetical protein Clacol_008599 [Clathrus columnatus]|uniref:NAD-dependent epimerase/dehydratase domain-containing protein n=1 Tax=Clathrus columnatus TaxID=1419009 RepID=A0AAV5AR36_9AGAM|nr:hypothetical protein Clacol_008599 [Clathrus columnatus]
MTRKPFVLVTGGTGFLGAHVVKQLLEAGYRVRCVARPLKSRFLEDAHRKRGDQLEVVEVVDLATANLDQALTDIQAIIHCAFPAPGSMESTALLMNGVSSTTNLLRQAYDRGIHKFVLTSSYLAMVGEPENVWRDYTFSDKDWNDASYEAAFDGTQDPAWIYAAAKKLTEAAAWEFARTHAALDLATVVPTLIIGPFAPGHAILSMADLSTNVLLHSLLTIKTPPHPVWPHFVDVRDVATAHIRALEAPPFPNFSRRIKPSLAHHSLPPTPRDTKFPPSKSHLSSPPSTTTDHMHFRNERRKSIPIFSGSSPPPKRFVVSGCSFTWAEVIFYLGSVRPDLAGKLPDEKECILLPENVAGLDIRWSGALLELDSELNRGETMVVSESDTARPSDDILWPGLKVQWRDWRETVLDGIYDLEKVTRTLERSGWEELFDDDEVDDGVDDVEQ